MNDDNYRFTADDGEANVPYDFLLEDNKPVKLGDGTFGCVFHIRGRNQNCALKIFYESDDQFVKRSQDREMSIGEELHKYYIDDHATGSAINKYLVVPIGHVTNFKSTSAYEHLKKYFETLSFKISEKAIVMEFYPMSLKDLLERGWPESDCHDHPADDDNADNGAIGRGAGGKFGDKSGYSILRSLSQMEKELCILPFVQDVAEGLSILHGPDFRHQDIKPANVLVRQVRDNIQAAVADLGFIDTGTWQVHGSIHQNRPLGTRHYRSPEQTDYFDLCEVDVKECGSGYELTTRDPKFAHTFSEKGDLVVFAKLQNPYQWQITDISIPEHGLRDGLGEEPIKIMIDKLEKLKLEADQRTQISVHKKQTLRTDLFGLGAIIYDMITCGRSPEQFYDLLRAHDRKEESIETGLGQRYLHFKNGGGTIPEIDAVFQSLRVDTGSDYPSLSIVKIILKCMMSRTSDSYFSLGGNNSNEIESNRIWEVVKKDLAAFVKDMNSGDIYRRIKENYLTSPSKKEIQNEIRSESQSPGVKLREIQNLSYIEPNECAIRAIKAFVFFKKVANMIMKEIRGGDDFSYLVDVSPDNLQELRGEFNPQYAFFDKKEDWENLLSSGNPKVVLQTFSTGCLLPPFMYALVRQYEIWIDEKPREGELPCVFFDPWGHDYGWPDVSKEDRLTFNLSPTLTINATIHSQENGMFKLEISESEVLKKLEPWRKYRAMIVRKFTPKDYYIGMLGTYIRHLFFVDPNNKRAFVPREVFELEQSRPVKMFQEKKKRKMLKILRSRSQMESRLHEFFKQLLILYLKSVTRQIDGMWKKCGFSLSENPAVIVDKVGSELEKHLKTAFEIEQDRNIIADEEALIQELSNKDYSIKKFPDIEEYCVDILKEWRRA